MKPFKLGKRTLMEIRESLLMTLPITWVRNNSLMKGQTVSVELDSDGNLVITPNTTENQNTNPAVGSELGGTTPITGRHQTPVGADADV